MGRVLVPLRCDRPGWLSGDKIAFLCILLPQRLHTQDTPPEVSDWDVEFLFESSSSVVERLNGFTYLLSTGSTNISELLADIAQIITYRIHKPNDFYDLSLEFRAFINLLSSFDLANSYYHSKTEENLVSRMQEWTSCSNTMKIVNQYTKQEKLTNTDIQQAITKLQAFLNHPNGSDKTWLLDFFLLVSSAVNHNLAAQYYDDLLGILPTKNTRNGKEGLTQFYWLLLTEGSIPPNTKYVQKYIAGGEDVWRSDQVTGRFIASSISQFTDNEYHALKQIAHTVAEFEPVRGPGMTKLIATFAAAGLLDKETMDNYWIDDASLMITYPWSRGVDEFVVKLQSGTVDWDVVTALSRAAQIIDMPLEKHEILYHIATKLAFQQPHGINELYAALGVTYDITEIDKFTTEIMNRLYVRKSDARHLITEAGSAAYALWKLPLQDKKQAVLKLKNHWRTETEPQLRLIIATILLTSVQNEFRFSELHSVTYGRFRVPY